MRLAVRELPAAATAAGGFLCRVQKAGGCKVGRNVALEITQLLNVKEFEAPTPAKALRLKIEERVELDLKFPAVELKEHSSLMLDARF